MHSLHARASSRTATAASHVVDPTRIDDLRQVLERVQPELFFHLAGVAATVDPAEYYRINVLFGANMLVAAARAGFGDRPVLVAGTAAEYGQVSAHQLPIREDTPAKPYGHYGISKLAQTQMALAMAAEGRPIVVVRPFNVVGAGMPEHISVQSFARQVAAIAAGARPVLKVGNLDSWRDFVDVDDLVRIYRRLVQTDSAWGKVVNICTGVAVSLRDVVARLIRLSGREIEVEVDPGRLKAVDVPLHFGSNEALRCLLGELNMTTLDTTLGRIWIHARGEVKG